MQKKVLGVRNAAKYCHLPEGIANSFLFFWRERHAKVVDQFDSKENIGNGWCVIHMGFLA
jgi:hypothetical protein